MIRCSGPRRLQVSHPNPARQWGTPARFRRNRRSRFAMIGVLTGLIVMAAGTLSFPDRVAGAAAPHAGSTVVTAKMNSTFGTILADGAGMTLYTLMNNGQPVLCTGTCAGAWPPLTVPSMMTPVTGPPGVTGLGTTSNANGVAVTFQGAPLYGFIGDHSPSDAKGDGVTVFGGTFHVVRIMSSAGSTVVTAKMNSTFGTILADGAGMTLYTLMNNGQPVLCTGTCAGAWPPLDRPLNDDTGHRSTRGHGTGHDVERQRSGCHFPGCSSLRVCW